MATQVTNYKCPACTAPLQFVGASGKLECAYCGSAFDVAEIEAMVAEAEAKAAQAHQDAAEKWDASEMEQWGMEEGMKAYSCPSCGAELICDATTAATACPYCGNPTVVPGQFSGGLKPNYIIPFKLDQAAAKAALAEYYKGKLFLPKRFASGNRIEEIKGVYVPFWFFDGEADADVCFAAESESTHTEGDIEVTETKHYTVRRAGKVHFEKIPVDASTKMPDAHMDAIEPYDYGELREFSSAYLPGYLADKYDVTADDCAARAEERATNTAVDAMRSDAKAKGYDTLNVKEKTVHLTRDKVHYGLLPVYMLATKWQDKDYLFAMNGQTGKLIGDLPVDPLKFWLWFAGITLGITALIGLLFSAFLVGLLVGAIIAFIVCAVFRSEMETAVKATAASAYIIPDGVSIRLREDTYSHTTRSERRIGNDPEPDNHSDNGSNNDE